MDPRRSVTFAQVRVEPARTVGSITGGGGICAPAEAPDWVETLRDGEPVADPVEPSDAVAAPLAGHFVWGGVTVHQPGHFVAEHVPRLLLAVKEHPDAKVLFLLRKGAAPSDLGGWFWDVLAWLGIDRDRVELVGETPVVVERLTVFPQAEHLTNEIDALRRTREADPTGMPDAAYLEALDANFGERGLEPEDHEIVYVSRAATRSGFAGEHYLERALQAAGVVVVRPEERTVADQMRVFAGARHLVFAEGSALHFRQLIGYRAQTITVLQRRPGSWVARGQLVPRAEKLEYMDVVRGVVVGPYRKADGVPATYAGLPLLDQEKLLGGLARLGVDLTDRWDEQEFGDVVREDLLAWAGYVRGLSRQDSLRYALNVVVSMTTLGAVADFSEEVARVIEPDRALSRLQDVQPVEQQRDRLAARVTALQGELASARTELRSARRQLDLVRGSLALRIGQTVLAPAAYAQRSYRRLRG